MMNPLVHVLSREGLFPSRGKRTLGAPGDPTWADVQTDIDTKTGATLLSAYNALASKPPGAVISSLKGIASYAQNESTWLQALGANTSTLDSLTASLGALTPTSNSTKTDAVAAMVLATRLYVELQSLIYKGTGGAVTLPKIPIAMEAAAGVFMLAYNTLGCAGLASSPMAVISLQRAYQWVVPGFTVTSVYDAPTAAALNAVVGSNVAPAVCAASSSTTTTAPSSSTTTTPSSSSSTTTTKTTDNAPAPASGSSSGVIILGTVAGLAALALGVVAFNYREQIAHALAPARG